MKLVNIHKDFSNKSGIYLLRNIINKKIYIGQAIDIFQRWCSHKGCYDDCYIHRAIRKHGWSNFDFEVLEVCVKEKLIEREQYYLDLYQSYNKKIGYNIRRFADSKFGYNHSEETKRKISISKTGRKATLEERKKRSEFSKLRKLSNKFFERAITSKYKKVFQFDLDGNLITEWESVKKASNELKIDANTLSFHCRSLANKPIKGFRWRYQNVLKFKKDEQNA